MRVGPVMVFIIGLVWAGQGRVGEAREVVEMCKDRARQGRIGVE